MRISDWRSDVCSSDLDGSLKAWLFAIAHRQFIDQRRRAGRWRNVLAMLGREPGAAPSAEETFVARSSLAAFDALAVDHPAGLLPVVVEGLPYPGAAHALAVPVRPVISGLSRLPPAHHVPTGAGTARAQPLS